MQSVILLHGAIGASDQLEPLRSELNNSAFRTFTFNFSGHGNIPFNASGFSIPVFADELKEFIQINKLEMPHVFGYSMGGYVALYLVSQHPNMLGHIATLGTKFSWSPEIAQREIKMLESETIIKKVPKFAEALKVRHGKQWEELLKKTAHMMLDLGNENALTEDDFRRIENKVLIGLAENDTMVTKEETENVFKQLKHAQMYTLSGAKHPIESVDVKMLTEFLIPHYK